MSSLLASWSHALFLFPDPRNGIRRLLNVCDRDNEVLGSGRAELKKVTEDRDLGDKRGMYVGARNREGK